MTFLETTLDELLKAFKKNGINSYTEEELINLLDIRASTFQELFPVKDEMVNQVIRYNNNLTEREHKHLLASAQNAVEEIFLLLKHGFQELQSTNHQYFLDIQNYYPEAWQIRVDHLQTYSYHQLYDVINKGIVDGLFRKDINIQLVVKIILEQVILIINPVAFPPNKFEMSEVFRSTFLYYIRGLCTEKGSKKADEFYSSIKL